MLGHSLLLAFSPDSPAGSSSASRRTWRSYPALVRRPLDLSGLMPFGRVKGAGLRRGGEEEICARWREGVELKGWEEVMEGKRESSEAQGNDVSGCEYDEPAVSFECERPAEEEKTQNRRTRWRISGGGGGG
eukprot:752819-Hanusia_phi.AAC.6